jgi:hypothetical protein
MTLNLSIISADLSDAFDIDGVSKVKRPAKISINTAFGRKLRFPVIYDNEMYPKDDRLYIAGASMLPKNIDLSAYPSFLCIGNPPAQYLDGSCDIAVLSAKIKIRDLLTTALEIFDKYNAWETAMQNAVIQNQSFKTFGLLSKSIFQNPIQFFDKNYKCIFAIIDNKYSLPNDYVIIKENDYWDIEEIKLVETMPSHVDLYRKKKPFIFYNERNQYRTLRYNIFIENKLMGTLFIDEINRKITDRDFALIMVLTDAITSMISKIESPVLSKPRYLEEILKTMIKHEPVKSDRLRSVLVEMNWNIYDAYFCATIESEFDEENYSSMTALSIKLSEQTATECYLMQKNTAVFIFNLKEGNNQKAAVIKTILSVLKNSAVKIGISNSFNDFNNLYYYYRQTMAAIEQGKEKAPSRQCYYFDDYILDSILQNSRKDMVPEALYPEGFLALERQDKLRGTNYVDTLEAFLESNMNIAETIKKIYMHRNTFLYRIGRIKEIMDMSLDDPDTRLLLRIILKLRRRGA